MQGHQHSDPGRRGAAVSQLVPPAALGGRRSGRKSQPTFPSDLSEVRNVEGRDHGEEKIFFFIQASFGLPLDKLCFEALGTLFFFWKRGSANL